MLEVQLLPRVQSVEAGTKLRLPADAMLGTSQTSSAYACHGGMPRALPGQCTPIRLSTSISPNTVFIKEVHTIIYSVICWPDSHGCEHAPPRQHLRRTLQCSRASSALACAEPDLGERAQLVDLCAARS